jgi:hypothetical protein
MGDGLLGLSSAPVEAVSRLGDMSKLTWTLNRVIDLLVGYLPEA